MTFDDAYESILAAVPLLQELQLRATVFVCSALAETGAPLLLPDLEDRSAGYLDELRTLQWEALRRLANDSIEIGSHTVSHPHLTRVTDEQLARELEESRLRIEEELGRPCRYLAYPYGEHDLRVRAAAHSAGYVAAFALDQTGSPLPEYALPRVDLYRKDGVGRLALKTSRLPARSAVAKIRARRNASLRGGPLLQAISLMYHDVVEPSEQDSSGFVGAGPARYKLDRRLFERHLSAFAAAGRAPSSAADLRRARRDGWPRGVRPLYLTFDDGGRSAVEIGARLADAGWVGHFFVPVDFVGKPGFLDEAGIAALAAGGHIIGSHSCSHPVPMTRLSDDLLIEEWRRSVAVLSEITEEEVFAASVPGGYSSRRVVRAAASSGIEILFVSDPVASMREVDGCLVLGRYAILAGTSETTATGLARGERGPRFRQLARWKLRAAPKRLSGHAYRRLRTAWLERK